MYVMLTQACIYCVYIYICIYAHNFTIYMYTHTHMHAHTESKFYSPLFSSIKIPNS